MPDSETILISMDGQTHSVCIRRDANARRLTLRIRPAKRNALLSLPARSSYAHAEAFVRQHASWIHEKLSALPAPIDLVPGATVPIRGFSHHILHAKDKRGVAWLSPGDPSNGIDPQLVVTGEVEHANRRVKDFLKRLARSDLDSAVTHYSSQLNLRKPNVSLRDTSSRWGSCSAGGDLNFSWRLILAPGIVLDYLAAHEVTHLVELNHSARFWRVLEKLCGHVEEAEQWLRLHGASLHRYR